MEQAGVPAVVPADREEISGTKEPGSADDLESLANDGAVTVPERPAANRWYSPPPPEKRRGLFIKSLVNPAEISWQLGAAALLTGRNAPKEWGGKWDGFGRRFASTFAKGVIKNSVKYGLDEALKVDSNFYLSRDRHPAARARNAVFSAVTARDRTGRRVIGIPRIAGSLAANVTAAEVWYPSRYNYVHGLKGSAISIALDAGFNLVREFVLKR